MARFEFDAKDLVYVRIDRRRKLPVTTLLLALESESSVKASSEAYKSGKVVLPEDIEGMSQEDVLAYFYQSISYTKIKKGWQTDFHADLLKGTKLSGDLVNAKTGKVVAEAGTKMTPRLIAQLKEKGLKYVLLLDEDLIGRYAAEDQINENTGEIYIEAGEEITEETLKVLADAKVEELKTLAIDHVNVGPYIRNTLAVDKNTSREEALIDIYRVMRPGEPPTLETAQNLFNSLFLIQNVMT